LFTFLVTLSASTVDASEGSADPSWQEQMTKLSKALTNVFPFLYSRSEFKDPKNSDSIKKYLQDLANTTHKLPSRSGENLIGAEPLIASAQMDMRGDLEKALNQYKKKNYPEAQSLAFGAIQKCFACHTAHQVGPHFPEMNSEIFAVATPFVLQKAVVFGALRQFDGALKFIETKAFADINKKSPTEDDLVKMYLVISLRSTQEFSRATDFLNRLKKEKGISSESSAIVDTWISDIKAWKAVAKKNLSSLPAAPTGKAPASFVQSLRDTYLVHNQLSTEKLLPKAKAELFQRLAQDYLNLNLSTLKDLPEIYSKACKDLDSSCPTKI
jgi:hypothetical protein